ncbi:MAG: mlaD [Gammaproteobacteria bacterium]|jgi:phospholipid/cholesterol/gamma-HCH transport system substrate-binding protein|nr:mlaD [Gammaproteobacteria bacterium]
MSKKLVVVEVLVGIFMILGALAFTFLAIKVSGLSTQTGTQSYYTVTADFDNIGSLKIRSPVMVAGVVIGQVKNIHLDPVTFRARVVLSILKTQNHLPIDTSADIYTQGLLGANYVNLTPGYEQTYLKEGSTIQTTQPALILEKLIGQFIYSIGNK